VLGVLLVVFIVVRLIPGDPAAVLLGPEGSAEERARLSRLLGLDRPWPVQFGLYVWRVAHGDLGRSIFLGSDVSSLILNAVPATLELAAAAMLLTVAIALPLGVLAAVRANTTIDLAATVGALIGVSMPIFWFGVLAILLFSLNLRLLPSFGRGPGLLPALGSGDPGQLGLALAHLAMPAVTLALGPIALVTRLTRSAMLEVLSRDYVRTARAKGLPERVVVYKHALRNALLPVVTVLGLQFGTLLGGAVITETIFAWPGLGRLIVGAIGQRDFALVQGGVIFVAVSVSLVNLQVDLTYALINPRIRYA
jgi:peptide/nickel transport system permease protein